MNFIKCEKLEKSMAELQFSIDAEAFKKLLPMFSRGGQEVRRPRLPQGQGSQGSDREDVWRRCLFL